MNKLYGYGLILIGLELLSCMFALLFYFIPIYDGGYLECFFTATLIIIAISLIVGCVVEGCQLLDKE